MLESFKFKKHLGQNFISDVNFLNAIVEDANVTKDDCVLEIGAGAGSLTEALASVCKKIVSIEKDADLKEFLLEKFKDKKNVQFIFDDFLKLNKDDLQKNLQMPYKIVANLPYYITTPIIFKIIEEEFNASSVTIMVQKEVADRLKAKPATKDYGAITAKLNLISNIEIVRQAPRTLFFPQPNVDSSVVKIDFVKKADVNKKVFDRVVNAGFRERRKMFVSNLAREFAIKKEVVQNVFEKCAIDLNVRAEVLSYEQFVKITQNLEELCRL